MSAHISVSCQNYTLIKCGASLFAGLRQTRSFRYACTVMTLFDLVIDHPDSCPPNITLAPSQSTPETYQSLIIIGPSLPYLSMIRAIILSLLCSPVPAPLVLLGGLQNHRSAASDHLPSLRFSSSHDACFFIKIFISL